MKNTGGPVLRVVPEAENRDLFLLPDFSGEKDGALSELKDLIGLGKVKNLIFQIYAFQEVQKKREKEGLKTEGSALHMVFKGNPGTGKTTVARIVGNLLKEAGILEKGHLVEVERADLVGEYVGHTAQRTKEHIKKARGGILFIDEAYSLARGGEKDFGKECIDCIVKGMEDRFKDMIVILAGYPGEMEYFMRTNPGLRSRFPIHLTFPDYTTEELTDIALLMLKKREYSLRADGYPVLRNLILKGMAGEMIPSNARLVRNMVEKAIRLQAVRLVKTKSFTKSDLTTVTPADLIEAGQECS